MYARDKNKITWPFSIKDSTENLKTIDFQIRRINSKEQGKLYSNVVIIFFQKIFWKALSIYNISR